MQLQTPAAWKWRTDSPATVSDSDKDLSADTWFFVTPPPGWHITSSLDATMVLAPVPVKK